MLFTSSRLATLTNCTCDRACPAVRSRTALKLRVSIYDVHCDPCLLMERGQLLLIARRLEHKRWHSAGMQRKWSFGLYK